MCGNYVIWAGSVASYLLIACSSGSGRDRVVDSNVGRACLPEPELGASFSGFSRGEVELTKGSDQCGTGVCLVNRFQGRVSCPQGQTMDASTNGTATCLVPGTTDPVHVPVTPQLVNRRDTDTVYCSCRCDGTESGATYCQCPSGTHCQVVMPDYGVGLGTLAGSYCVKDGTDDDGLPQATCTACSTTQLSVPKLTGSALRYLSWIDQLPLGTDASSGSTSVGCLATGVTANSPVPACAVVAAYDASNTTGCGSGQSLLAAGDPLGDDIRSRLRDDSVCDTASSPACKDLSLCRIDPALGAADVATCGQNVAMTTPDYCSCLNDPQSTAAGYCYIDSQYYVSSSTIGVGNPTFVANCPDTQARTLRIPRLGSPLAAYAACQDHF
jgi:hypothetical protein